MANGLPATEAHVLTVTQRLIATIALTQKSGVPARKAIPSWMGAVCDDLPAWRAPGRRGFVQI
jgi:hypothetical protein